MSAKQDELINALYEVHGARLLRFVVQMTKDLAMAQDVVQEAMLRAWKDPKILDQGDEGVSAWLFTVARNLVIDDRRSARFRREVSSEVLPEVISADETDATLETWIFSDALSTLSEQHRRVVISSYYLGQSISEIAREEGTPEGTVKSRLHYALRALRLALQERGAIQ